MKALAKEAAKTLSLDGNKYADNIISGTCALLSTKVGNLNISVRALNVLRMADIETLGDLVRLTERDAKELRHMGNKCFYELDDLLDMYNLSWGMDVDSYYAAFGTLIKD